MEPSGSVTRRRSPALVSIWSPTAAVLLAGARGLARAVSRSSFAAGATVLPPGGRAGLSAVETHDTNTPAAMAAAVALQRTNQSEARSGRRDLRICSETSWARAAAA